MKRDEEEKVSSSVEQEKRGKRRRGRLRKWVQDEAAGEEDQEAVQKWLTDVSLSSKKIREAQREDPVIGYFLNLKRGESKPNWDEVADQGNKLKSLWAQWESLKIGASELLFRKLTGPGSLRMMQVVTPRKMIDAVL